MNSVPVSEFRDNLKSHLNNIIENHSQLIVKRTRGEDVIVMSLDDYNTIMETFSQLSYTNNAVHLIKSLDQIKKEFIKKISLKELLENE